MEEVIKMLPRYRIPVIKKKRNKKKTHEEYVEELKLKNPNIEVVEEYKGANIKIKHCCLIDGYEWEVTPHNIFSGRGCPKCTGKIKKTHNEYINEVSLVNPNVLVLGKYINFSTPILHRCIIHNIEWNALPSNILKGHGCKQCGADSLKNQKAKTHQQYIEDVSRVNSNIKVLSEYVNAFTPILHKCLIDGYEWLAKPNNILSGRCCPKCGGTIKKTHDEYIEELLIGDYNVEVLEKYINANTPILHRCKEHNIVWKTTPSRVLQGNGCYECLKEKISINNSKSHNEYVEELSKINPNIVVVGTYINANTPVLHKCLIDENEWRARPTNILSGQGCPKCNESKGERQISLLLDNLNIEYIRQYKFDDCKNIKPLPFDFYLPKYNMCIEYDGEQHFRPVEHFGGEESFERTIKHDKIKNEYCKNNGISLLRIPYFKNIEKELNNFLFI